MIKDWKKNFHETILNRGRNYLNQDRVGDIKIEEVPQGFNFYAEVYGTRKYTVSGAVNNDKLKLISCNCPHARQGINCKHMAAVLFKIEEDEAREARRIKELENPRTRLENPFVKNDSEESYILFDINKLTKDFIIYEDTFKRAKALYKKDSQDFEFHFVPRVYSNGEREYSFRCYYMKNYISLFPDSIDAIHCIRYHWTRYSLKSRYSEEELTLPAAAIAMLYASDIFIQEHAHMLDITDSNSRLLMNYSRNSIGMGSQRQDSDLANNSTVASSKDSITLLPTLVRTDNDYALNWKIGDAQKLYVLKNVNDLIGAYSLKSRFALGKNKDIDFSKQDFDNDGKAYYKIISDSVDNAKKALEYVQTPTRGWQLPTINIKKKTPIYDSNWDDFYETSKDKDIVFQDHDSKEKLKVRFGEGTPSANLTINKIVNESGVFDGIDISGNLPKIIHGNRHSYFIDIDDKYCNVNRIPEEVSTDFGPLELVKTKNNLVSLQVGRNNLSEFYNYTLPTLRNFVDFEEPDDEYISQYVQTPPDFTIFLDAVDGIPEAKLSVTYGDNTYSVFDWENPGIDKRNRMKYIEYRAAVLLETYLSDIDLAREVFCCEKNDDAVYRMLTQGLKEMLDFCQVQSTEQFDRLKVCQKSKISIGISIDNGLMNLEISADALNHDELLSILESYKKRKKYHKLKGGQFVDINEDFQELGNMVNSLNLSPKEFVKGKAHLPLYRTLYLEKLLEENNSFYTQRDNHFKELVRDFKTINESDYEVPKKMGTVMRNYQIFGHKWLRMMTDYGFGCILADDMGLGKTLQVISVLEAHIDSTQDVSASLETQGLPQQNTCSDEVSPKAEGKTAFPSIVICPASLIYNWESEFEKFAPEIRIKVIAGSKSTRAELIKNYEDFDVLITSYDFFKRDVHLYEDCNFEFIVIDEAQYIKNHTTGAAKSVKVLKGKKKIALTGTPIENRLSELWSIFDFLMPGFLYGYDHFRKQFETPIIKNNDDEIMARLKKMVKPFILRRLKSDVLKDLPEKIEEDKYIKMGDKQRNLYDGQIVKLKNYIKTQKNDALNKEKFRILAELTKTRQICCDPSVIFEDYDGGSAKTDACIQLLESAIDGEHKVLVFSQFTSILDILGEELTTRGIKWYSITGKTQKRDRLSLVKKFNEGDVPVFLISLKAGGTGLNLTGADIVIHFDPWWNVAAQNQATDRAHRIGQEKSVTVYKLITKESIEEKILDMQRKKKALADEIISGEFKGLSSMSKDELLELLE